jgi:quercetin dioxygenase-like cupin family protein
VIDSRSCTDLNDEINSLLNDGFRLDMITPADAPREALLSRNGQQVRLTTNPKSQIPHPKSTGRAGMQYRDLIPNRLNGQVIASHIRINDGGPVPDYVHYHKIRFQMIYCRAGWVRVVYEDQGPPLVLNAGDCVLQPPEIRHRVLESSAGAEVIEVGSPAEHETWVEHELSLPNDNVDAERIFGGQRFARHVAADAAWCDAGAGLEYRDTGILKASCDVGDVRVYRASNDATLATDPDAIRFLFVLNGSITDAGENDSIVLEPGNDRPVDIAAGSDVLVVSLFAL